MSLFSYRSYVFLTKSFVISFRPCFADKLSVKGEMFTLSNMYNRAQRCNRKKLTYMTPIYTFYRTVHIIIINTRRLDPWRLGCFLFFFTLLNQITLLARLNTRKFSFNFLVFLVFLDLLVLEWLHYPCRLLAGFFDNPF